MLDWVDSFKYLGITLDRRLKWSSQTEEVTKKAFQVLNFLCRNLQGCSKDAKKVAYLALVRPYQEYCAPVWSPRVQKDVKLLDRVQ